MITYSTGVTCDMRREENISVFPVSAYKRLLAIFEKIINYFNFHSLISAYEIKALISAYKRYFFVIIAGKRR